MSGRLRFGIEIIHLELGQPDIDTPAHIQAAGISAIQAGRTRYGSSAGTNALREAIAGFVQRTRGVETSPGRVLAAPGVKAAIYFGLMALVEPGDEVLMPDLGFPGYEQITRIAQGRPVRYSLRAENGFEPDAAEIERLITPRSKCIILNSPGNPSGTIHRANTLHAMAEIANRHDLWVKEALRRFAAIAKRI